MRKFFGKIKIYFFSGLILLLPIALTFYIIYYVSRLIYKGLDFVLAFVPEPYKSLLVYKIIIVLCTGVVLFFFTVLIGIFIRTVVGRTIEKFIDRLFGSVPGVKGFYKALKQLFDLIFRKREDTSLRPVLVEYPHKGKYAVAFVTGETSPKTAPDTRKKYYTVFMPTTPNPTTGFLMIIPQDEIIQLDITRSEALKMIFSGGIVQE